MFKSKFVLKSIQDIDEIMEFSKKVLGDKASTAMISRDFLLHLSSYNDCGFCIKDIEVRGFFVVCFLTQNTVEKIDNGYIKSGHQLFSSEYLSSKEDAYGLYILGVYADENRYSRASLIWHLDNFLLDFQDIPIYTKVSSNSFAAAKRRGFKKMDGDIWCVSFK